MVPKKILQLAVVSLLWISCSERKSILDSDVLETSTDSTSIQRDTAYGVQIKLSKSGHVNSVIDANIMVREAVNNRPNMVYLYDGVKIRYMNDRQEVLNTVDAKYGTYDEVRKVVVLQDSVFVKNINNESLKTEYLTWADSSHEFWTDQKILINTTRQQIEGVGLRAAEDFSTYSISEIKGIIQVEDDALE